MCIIINRQILSLYHNSSVWLHTENSSSLDRNPPKFTLDLVSYHAAIRWHTSTGNYNALCISFRLFTFCLTGYQSSQFIRRALHYSKQNYDQVTQIINVSANQVFMNLLNTCVTFAPGGWTTDELTSKYLPPSRIYSFV